MIKFIWWSRHVDEQAVHIPFPVLFTPPLILLLSAFNFHYRMDNKKPTPTPAAARWSNTYLLAIMLSLSFIVSLCSGVFKLAAPLQSFFAEGYFQFLHPTRTVIVQHLSQMEMWLMWAAIWISLASWVCAIWYSNKNLNSKFRFFFFFFQISHMQLGLHLK